MTESCGCPQDPAGFSRRTFLKAVGITGAVLSAGPYARAAFATDPGAYSGDTLVVLSLRGGFDGLSVIAPIGDPDYARLRPTIAVPSSTALPTGDRLFGLHPALSPLQKYWDDGTFGAVHAVGTDSSRSHFQAQEELERAAPGSSIRTGWLDRAMGSRGAPASVFQTVQLGKGSPSPLLAGPTPVLATRSLSSFKLSGSDSAGRFAAATRALQAGSATSWAHAGLDTLSAVGRAATMAAADPGPQFGAVYPKTSLGAALADVALLIRARVGLQAIALDMGNWDMHSGLGRAGTGWMATQLTELASSLAAFATDLGSSGLAKTSVVTISEFGRRAKENASAGVDHGYGNAVLFMGGGLHGGRVHGRWPGLSPEALDHGDLAATTDYRDVLAELLQARCGQGGMEGVFPGHRSTPVGVC